MTSVKIQRSSPLGLLSRLRNGRRWSASAVFRLYRCQSNGDVFQAKAQTDASGVKYTNAEALRWSMGSHVSLLLAFLTSPMAVPEAQPWEHPMSCSPSSPALESQARGPSALDPDLSEPDFLFPAAAGSPA